MEQSDWADLSVDRNQLLPCELTGAFACGWPIRLRWGW